MRTTGAICSFWANSQTNCRRHILNLVTEVLVCNSVTIACVFVRSVSVSHLYVYIIPFMSQEIWSTEIICHERSRINTAILGNFELTFQGNKRLAEKSNNIINSSAASIKSAPDVMDQTPDPSSFAKMTNELKVSQTNIPTMVFDDEQLGTSVIMQDEIRDISEFDHLGTTDLDKFLARPIRINHSSWAALNGVTLSPWNSILTNDLIKNKILNYAYLRATLCIKFVVNSTPFNFGALQACYYPYNIDQSSRGYGIAPFSMSNPIPALGRRYLQSTLPNVVLEASKSKGGEMRIPFIYDRNFLDLRTQTGVSRLGVIHFRDLVNLDSASTATEYASVITYAWLEDVTLTGATGVTVLQSDCYGSGPVSRPASVVAAISGRLKDAPIIGPYARATNIAATAIGKVASMFGYSNVPLIEPIRHYRTTGIGNAASAEIGSHIEKLSLDPKNELSIDPKIVGANDDEMLISRIASHEGLYTIIPYNTTQAVDTQIFSIRVTPSLARIFSFVSGDDKECYYLPPVSHVSQCFSFWRGDLIYRFKCIKTPYHKGRVRISWDTIGQPIRDTNSIGNSLNVIWDLADSDELEFVVPYQNETAFLPTDPKLNGNYTITDNTTLTDNAYSNGVLSMIVVSELTAPIDTSEISFLLYVRAADNFELAGPKNPLGVGDDSLKHSFLVPQSDGQLSVGFRNEQPDDKIYSVHFGEVVKSVKNLMYRTNHLCTMGGTGTANYRTTITRPRLPQFYGYDPFGLASARNQANNDNKSFNWVRTTPYHWFSCAYVFQRGSHNYRLLFWDSTKAAWVTRVPYLEESGVTNNDWRPNASTDFDTTGRGLLVANPNIMPAGSGTTIAVPSVNPLLEFSLPLYSRYRAVTNFPYSVNLPPYAWYYSNYAVGTFNTSEENARDGHNLEGWVATTYNTGGDARHDLFHSVGIDFSLQFYRGCPALFTMTVPAAAV